MIAFRLLLVVMFLLVTGYSVAVGSTQGWDLVTVFVGDIVRISWPGQFNVDFSCLLLLSGLWVAWRHDFSVGGILLGLLASVGGTAFLAPYLLVVSLRARGDMHALLLGRAHVAR